MFPVHQGRAPIERTGWVLFAVFAVVFAVQLALVAFAGTDIPFQDQWDIEGRWLYPQWADGTWRAADALAPFNEHRILWTHLLNLALFWANGGWDPLVQLFAIAGLRAACAAGIAWFFVRTHPAKRRSRHFGFSLVVAVAFLPQLAWHNVLWGFQSHVYFALGFSLLTLALLGVERPSWSRMAAGVAAGLAGLLAMGSAALVPVALLGLAVVRGLESRTWTKATWRQIGPAVLLLLLALGLRAPVAAHQALQATDWKDLAAATGRMLAWPHVGQPWAALPMNLPLLLLVVGRIRKSRTAVPGEDGVLLMGLWSASVGLATAFARGGSPELAVGVPSRYVDFIVLLPLANLWGALILASEWGARWSPAAPDRKLRSETSVRWVTSAWIAFVVMGWLGLSLEMMRGVVLPRIRDREAPVRLAVAFQRSGDSAVFDGQPRLLVPHPNLDSVRRVLADPRMQGALPPSLQPDRPLGPLSRIVRACMGRVERK